MTPTSSDVHFDPLKIDDPPLGFKNLGTQTGKIRLARKIIQ